MRPEDYAASADDLLVDILLPTYNGANHVEASIASIQAQTHGRWRLHVIDDGSSDDTVGIVETTAAHPDAAGRVVLHRSPGLRAVGARMSIVSELDGEFLAFIDQDDVWHPEKLTRQVERLTVGLEEAVHTAVRHIDGVGGIRPGGAWEENRHRRRLGPSGFSADALAVRNSVRLATAVVLRTAFLDVGGFDPTLDGGEDWDFWFRFAAAGHRIGYIDDVLVDRRVHGSNTSITSRGQRRNGLGRAVDAALRTHPRHRRALSTRLAVVSVGTAASALRRGDVETGRAELRRACSGLRAGRARSVACYGFDAALRSIVPRLAGRLGTVRSAMRR